MKTKKQIIKKPYIPTIPSSHESVESYAVKKIAKMFVGICILAVIVLSFFMLRNKPSKLQEQLPSVQTPKIPIMTFKNQTFLVIDGVAILNLPKKDWARLTNAFPHNLKTDTITFSK